MTNKRDSASNTGLPALMEYLQTVRTKPRTFQA
jgi:hypothetical protein